MDWKDGLGIVAILGLVGFGIKGIRERNYRNYLVNKFGAEHWNNVDPLDGPCLHCGNDMFNEAHKSWFCDRDSGGCGIVAHFVDPFSAEQYDASGFGQIEREGGRMVSIEDMTTANYSWDTDPDDMDVAEDDIDSQVEERVGDEMEHEGDSGSGYFTYYTSSDGKNLDVNYEWDKTTEDGEEEVIKYWAEEYESILGQKVKIGSKKHQILTSQVKHFNDLDSHSAEEDVYFVFEDGTTMIQAEDADNAIFLQWKIPYSQIRDYVNKWTDDLKEDQEWRLGDGPYHVAYDFAHGKSAPDIFTEPFGEEFQPPYTMEWAKEIEDAVKSRIWMLSDNYNDVVDLDDKMTKAEIRSFLTGIPSWRKEIAKRAESHAYSYAYNEGHSDSRKTGEYRPSLTGAKQEAAFKRIMKQKGE